MARNILLRLVADVDPARRGLRGARQDLKDLDRTRAEPLVQIRQRAAEAQLRTFNDRLEKLSKQKSTPRVQIAMGNTARQIERTERELRGLARTGEITERKLRGVGRGIGGGVGGIAASLGGAYAIVTAYKGVTGAYGEAEVSQAKMQAQLRALDINYEKHAGQIDEVITKTSQLSGLDDEGLQDAFSNIVLVTEDVNEALNLTGLAADFARRKNIDVAKAGEILGKVAGGNTGILSRYGIKLAEGATAAEALDALQRKLAGSAEAYGKTQKGASDRVGVAFENLKETIGEKLAPVLTRAANRLADFINEMVDGTGAGGRFADTAKEIAKKIGNVVGWFNEHKKAIGVAIAAWFAYRVAARAAMAATRLRLAAMFLGLGPKAAIGGVAAGGAFGRASASRAMRLLRGFGWVGLGLAIGDMLGLGISRQLSEVFGGKNTKLEDAIDEIRRRQEKAAAIDADIRRGQPGPSGWDTGRARRPPRSQTGGKGGGFNRSIFAMPTVSAAGIGPITRGRLPATADTGGYAPAVFQDNRNVYVTTPSGRAPDADYLARQLDRKLGARGRGS